MSDRHERVVSAQIFIDPLIIMLEKGTVVAVGRRRWGAAPPFPHSNSHFLGPTWRKLTPLAAYVGIKLRESIMVCLAATAVAGSSSAVYEGWNLNPNI